MAVVVKKIELQGASYDRKKSGAECPNCRTEKAAVIRTLPWEGDIRIRYHHCQSCGMRFKSIEEDRL